MAETEILIGRNRERKLLREILASGKAELVALYGRRRVGKTFLVRALFLLPPAVAAEGAEAPANAPQGAAKGAALESRPGRYFEVTGTKNAGAAVQRRRFREAIEQAFAGGQLLPDFRGWEDAFRYLTELVERRATDRPDEPIVLFFDELPWLATPRSRLLETIDYYWNRRLSRIPQVKLILCGSAASWMLQRIIRAKGGLHNRITRRIRLEPFTVREANAYLEARRIRLAKTELLELYMALGGIPYYLSLVSRGQSVAETVGRLCFERSGDLQGEFARVFESLFSDHEDHIAILRALARRQEGITRPELIAATRFDSGGNLNRRLQELEEAGFIARIEPYRKKVRSTLFRIVDEYTLFYLRWIERAPTGILARGGAGHWRSTSQTPSYRSWAGYAFESVCLKHAREIEVALGIENLVTMVGSWRLAPRKRSRKRQGAQIDLLFDRRDGVINLCEIKFGAEPFVLTKEYFRELREKVVLFEAHARTRKRIIVTLIVPQGLKRNVWSEELVDQVVDASALF